MFGIEAGNDGVMVGKGERGVAGKHALRSPDTLLAQCQQVGGGIFLGVVPAEAVERDEDDVMLLERVRGVRSVVGVNNYRGVRLSRLRIAAWRWHLSRSLRDRQSQRHHLRGKPNRGHQSSESAQFHPFAPHQLIA